jgi:hypothetical protein
MDSLQAKAIIDGLLKMPIAEMTSLHDDVRTTNDNLGRVNQNILDHWRGVKPTLTLSPLSTPKN